VRSSDNVFEKEGIEIPSNYIEGFCLQIEIRLSADYQIVINKPDGNGVSRHITVMLVTNNLQIVDAVGIGGRKKLLPGEVLV